MFEALSESKTVKSVSVTNLNLSGKYVFWNTIMLCEAKFFMLNTYFCDKNGLLPLNIGSVAKIENLTLSPFALQILTDKIFIWIVYRNWV